MKALPILVMGLSGSGKSSAIKTLNPEETFIISCCVKALPFKEGYKLYTELSTEKNPTGNMLTTDNYKIINKTINYVDKKRTDIKTIVIDDSQFLIIHEFMERHSIDGKGRDVFQLYNDIADHFYHLIYDLKDVRDDLVIFFLHHAELSDDNTRYVPKTIGKLLNEKIEIPSMFTVVLYAVREVGHNYFLTQNDGSTPAKSPEGMFNDLKIANDLQLVRDTATVFLKGE